LRVRIPLGLPRRPLFTRVFRLFEDPESRCSHKRLTECKP
jgi:hypothetical protein